MTEALDDIARKAGPLRSPLRAALAYAEAGVAVLPVAGMGEVHCGCGRPCDNPAKHPLTRHGVRDASVDTAQIRRWWLQWPEANVGIATGARSGLAVVDVDGKAGGRASVADLHANGQKLPPTLTAFTGGGYHLYYRQPSEVTVANTVGRLPNVGPVAGVDVRGDGGYVVAPPSVHVSGMTYTWYPGPPHRMATLPQWMWPPPPPPTGVRAAPPARSEETSPYGAAALAREVEGVRRLAVGQRNDGLNRACVLTRHPGRRRGTGRGCGVRRPPGRGRRRRPV